METGEEVPLESLPTDSSNTVVQRDSLLNSPTAKSKSFRGSQTNKNLTISLPQAISSQGELNVVQNLIIEQDSKQARRFTWTSALRITMYISAWYFFSTALSFYNKYLMGKDGFNLNLPSLVSAMHTGMHFIITSFLMRGNCSMLYVSPEAKSVKSKSYWSRVVPAAITAALEICMSNGALVYITLSFYTMVKSSTPIWVLLFAFVFGLEQPRLSLIMIISVISFGVGLTVAGEAKFDLIGFFLILGAAIFSGLRWSLMQMLLQKEAGMNDPIATLYYVSPVMFILMITLSLFFENPINKFATSEHFQNFSSAMSTFGLMLAGGLLAFFMTVAEFALIKNTSTVTLSVAGISKEVFIITLSVLINHDILTPINVIG
ncbi:10904_t:CDS:2, partial [Paraglomus occultum]